MRFAVLLVAVGVVALTTCHALAQNVANAMLLQGANAATWNDHETNVIHLNGPVTIDLDRTHLSADQAVVWLKPTSGAAGGDQQQAEIALIGNAVVKQGEATRSGNTLFVTATVNGSIRITAAQRLTDPQTDTAAFKTATTMRQQNAALNPPSEPSLVPALEHVNRAMPVTPAPVNPPPLPPQSQTVTFQADSAPIMLGPGGHVVVVMDGHLLLMVDRDKGERIEMQAEHMVIYTTFKSLSEARSAGPSLKDKVQAVYLEGDVRLDYTPPDGSKSSGQRMTAERAFYELNADRAILTDAVFHTVDPKTNIPVVMRADTLRQLATDHFKAEGVRMTTSTFANPSFAVAASSAYVTREETGDPRLGDRFNFAALNVRPQFFGVPVFYLPVAGGSITERGFPLRNIGINQSNKFGYGIETEWGLAETLGFASPKDLDISYRADYFSDRGPAGGIDAKYSGGFVTETTRQPWNFQGDFKSYFVDDHGIDRLGGNRPDVDPDEKLRGRILWQHQHFLPEDWQIQTRVGFVSDATFLEEWFPREYEDGLPNDLSFYAKRQRDSEGLTLLVEYQPNNIVTDAEFAQEQFEVARLPEIGYHRIGDSLGDDFTFFSDNTLSALEFQTSGASLAKQGYINGLTPGLPAEGQTGTTGSVVYRGDFRQEVDYPFSTGHFKVVPYVLARLTDYSDSPDEGTQNRLYTGGGVRINTSFWQTDDAAESNLFDIHRVRHVIEPELNLYTSAETTDRNSVFIYDEQVDNLQDVSAVNFAVNQRWQTKRGGPGKWRSVDFFTFNVSANFYANKPPDSELEPSGFRGLFFPSAPETSIPRDSINADASWRISDDTILIADTQYNAEERKVATAAIGLAVRRDERLSYTVGNSYINELHSNITSVGLIYEISKKYTIGYSQSFDFGQGENVNFGTTLTRKFDTFALVFRINHDEITGESSVGFNLQPAGANGAFGTDSAQAFTQRR